MTKAIKIVFWIILFLLVAVFIIFAVGPQKIVLGYLSPNHAFDMERASKAPDYSLAENWAALPNRDGLADLRPEGVELDTLLQKVDVFFIHPTGYLVGKEWNSPMNTESATHENTQWMMANQASVFSDCKVYAPRYRQATIYSFFEDEKDNGRKALDFAYKDVERAFDHFIENFNQGRPFIIASHSQGSEHGLPLLKNRVDGTELTNRLIAAYLIGINSMTNKAVGELKQVEVCETPTQNQCLIHWATYSEEKEFSKERELGLVCVNPLTWKRDGSLAPKELHKELVKQSGSYSLKFWGEDEPNHPGFQALPVPIVQHTHAACEDGVLFIQDQGEGGIPMLGGGNYHGMDYLMFHMDIRENVSERYRAYLNKNRIDL